MKVKNHINLRSLTSYSIYHLLYLLFFISVIIFIPKSLFGFDQKPSSSEEKTDPRNQEEQEVLDPEDDPDAILDNLMRNSGRRIRRFHEVFDELLAEFGYDVKLGQLNNVKNLAIRKVVVSDALPDTYRKYTKSLVVERIRQNSTVRVLSCISCESRYSKVVEGKIIITSPATNVDQLKTAAERIGIDNFLDIVLVYHSTHMVLAFEIFKASTHELVWSKTYNSETIRTRYQKLAIDYSQIAKAKPGDEYQPEYRQHYGIGGGAIPNIGGTSHDSKIFTLHLRGTEKYDRRRSEFGLLMPVYITVNSILKEYPILAGTGTTSEEEASTAADSDYEQKAQPKPFSFGLGLYGLYQRNTMGPIENFSTTRFGFNAALGVFISSGYFAPSMRFGVDTYFGKRFSLSTSIIYISSSQILLNNEIVSTKGGFGLDIVYALNY